MRHSASVALTRSSITCLPATSRARHGSIIDQEGAADKHLRDHRKCLYHTVSLSRRAACRYEALPLCGASGRR
jgi:hypothetical protein